MTDTTTTRGSGARPQGWALLWSASAMALAPQRIILAFLAVSAIMVVGSLFDSVAGEIENVGYGVFEMLSASLIRAAGETAEALLRLDLAGASISFNQGFIATPVALANEAPWRTAALVICLIPVWSILGGAVARAAAMEAARNETTSVPQALAYALSRARALVGAYFLPIGLIALCAALLWIFGVLLLSLPGLNVVGGILYGIALLLGFLLALLTVGLAVGFPLLIPAVAADSADIADAFQRTYAYLIERPFSLLVWGVTLLAQGLVGVFILAVIITLAINWTADLTGAASDNVAGNVRFFAPLPERADLEGTLPLVAGVIGVWERVALAVVGAHAISFFFCASTVVYLRVRQACDGQAIEDVWPRITAIESVRRGDLEAIADTHEA